MQRVMRRRVATAAARVVESIMRSGENKRGFVDVDERLSSDNIKAICQHSNQCGVVLFLDRQLCRKVTARVIGSSVPLCFGFRIGT